MSTASLSVDLLAHLIICAFLDSLSLFQLSAPRRLPFIMKVTSDSRWDVGFDVTLVFLLVWKETDSLSTCTAMIGGGAVMMDEPAPNLHEVTMVSG